MSEYTSSGKQPKLQAGHTVRYTAHDGRQHDAVVESMSGDMANLAATIDGQHQKFTSVPHSATGGAHTWDHQRQ